MISTIELEKIELYAFHGCFAEEQVVGNHYEVYVSLDVDVDKASLSDNITDALNYVEVYAIVRDEMAVKSHLLEHVTRRICNRIYMTFSDKGLVGGKVKVSKMSPPVGGQMRCVSLVMNIDKNVII